SRDRFFWAHFTDQPRPGGLGALRVLAKGSLYDSGQRQPGKQEGTRREGTGPNRTNVNDRIFPGRSTRRPRCGCGPRMRASCYVATVRRYHCNRRCGTSSIYLASGSTWFFLTDVLATE